jgi:hypothetical protein
MRHFLEDVDRVNGAIGLRHDILARQDLLAKTPPPSRL